MTPTARPWTIRSKYSIDSESGDTVATATRNDAVGEANAAHIVHCVNTHDALVEALAEVARALPSPKAKPSDLPFLQKEFDYRKLYTMARKTLDLARKEHTS